jgi:hypothetical protein
MRAEPRALSRPSRLKPVPADLSLYWRSIKRPAEASLRESAKPVTAARRNLRIRADQSPSFLGERTPRTETSLTAGRWLGLTHWHCGHASHKIMQWPVNMVVVEGSHHTLPVSATSPDQ